MLLSLLLLFMNYFNTNPQAKHLQMGVHGHADINSAIVDLKKKFDNFLWWCQYQCFNTTWMSVKVLLVDIFVSCMDPRKIRKNSIVNSISYALKCTTTETTDKQNTMMPDNNWDSQRTQRLGWLFSGVCGLSMKPDSYSKMSKSL